LALPTTQRAAMKAVPLASAALASVVHRFPDTIGEDAGRVVSLQHLAP
jgi:hypothetical protein